MFILNRQILLQKEMLGERGIERNCVSAQI